MSELSRAEGQLKTSMGVIEKMMAKYKKEKDPKTLTRCEQKINGFKSDLDKFRDLIESSKDGPGKQFTPHLTNFTNKYQGFQSFLSNPDGDHTASKINAPSTANNWEATEDINVVENMKTEKIEKEEQEPSGEGGMMQYSRGKVKLLDDTLDIYDKSIDKLRGIISLNEDTLEIAQKAGEQLKKQTEKLKSIQDELDEMGGKIKQGEKLTKDIKRRLAGDLCIVGIIVVVVIIILIFVVVKIVGQILKCDVLSLQAVTNPQEAFRNCPFNFS